MVSSPGSTLIGSSCPSPHRAPRTTILGPQSPNLTSHTPANLSHPLKKLCPSLSPCLLSVCSSLSTSFSPENSYASFKTQFKSPSTEPPKYLFCLYIALPSVQRTDNLQHVCLLCETTSCSGAETHPVHLGSPGPSMMTHASFHSTNTAGGAGFGEE